MFYERLKLLAKEKKKSFNEIESELGYSKNSMYHYKKVKPSSDKLSKLAEYFGVSSDYLLGNTSDDGINWDEWLSFGGKPISEHDKNKIKEIFGDRLKD